MECKTVFIYGLCESGSDDVRYVGKTEKIKSRRSTHIQKSKKSNSHKSNWIKSIIKKGGELEIFVIDEVKESEWEFWEIYWIEQFRNWGFRLTNVLEGGESFNILTEEIRKKLRESSSGYKNGMFGKKSPTRKPVLQYDCNGSFIKEWESINDAKNNNNKSSSINRCCSGKQKTAGGFVWRYKESDNFPLKIDKIKNVFKKTYNERKVFQISLDGKIIKTWDSNR